MSILPDFQRVTSLAANRTGRILNQSELARDAALPRATCHRYLNPLETGCVITRLAPYVTNPTTSLVTGEKLLWNDCGLAAWLAGIKSPTALAQRLDPGFWLEQTLFQTLQMWRSIGRLPLRSWQDKEFHKRRCSARRRGSTTGRPPLRPPVELACAGPSGDRAHAVIGATRSSRP